MTITSIGSGQTAEWAVPETAFLENGDSTLAKKVSRPLLVEMGFHNSYRHRSLLATPKPLLYASFPFGDDPRW